MAFAQDDHAGGAGALAGEAGGDPLLSLARLTEGMGALGEMAELQRFANAGRLVASVAHEIRNALAAAHAGLGYLSSALLAQQSELAAAADEARESIDRALSASRNVLELVRGKSGPIAAIAPAKVVQKALQTVGSRLSGGVRLELDLEPVTLVAAEESGLHQALVNVLLNAIDAVPAGSGKLRVSVRQLGERVRIAVADNGPGIAPEILERLFQPMVTGSLSRGGTGLGLSISRAIVRSLGGEMHAGASALGGAEMVITLLASTGTDAVAALR